MKIKLMPGERDEGKIAELKNAMETLSGEGLEEFFCSKACEGEEWFDAMYYAAEDGGNNTVLQHWELYFEECLFGDEKYNYAADCGNYDCTIV